MSEKHLTLDVRGLPGPPPSSVHPSPSWALGEPRPQAKGAHSSFSGETLGALVRKAIP